MTVKTDEGSTTRELPPRSVQGDFCNVDFCQHCGLAYNPVEQGYVVDTVDVGDDPEGDTARLFREDAEKFGEWQGFKEEDIGPWCDSCSWVLQRSRTTNQRRGATSND